MKILVVTPSENEIKNGDDRSMHFVKNVVNQIKAANCGIEVFQLDITKVNIFELSVKEAQEIIDSSGFEFNEVDIIHTFSMLPFLFKPLFSQLVISSFNVDGVNEALRPFLPCSNCPGYARYDISTIESIVIEELYSEAYNNRRSFDKRPWGWWKSLELDKNFKIKHIYVAPGEKLSLQTHRFRSEIWTVASGSGQITIANEIFRAEKGKVFNIGKGQIHRAEGGENGLHIVEVQTGDYLGEDDIIRLEDIYGRK